MVAHPTEFLYIGRFSPCEHSVRLILFINGWNARCTPPAWPRFGRRSVERLSIAVNKMSAPESQVFYDPRGRRWKRVRRTWLALAVAATALAAVFIVSVLVNPILPQLNLRQYARSSRSADATPTPTPPPLTRAEEKAQRAADELKKTLRTTNFIPARRPSQMQVTPPPAQAQAVTQTDPPP